MLKVSEFQPFSVGKVVLVPPGIEIEKHSPWLMTTFFR